MDYTVLVIDDDEPIHFMVKSLLGSEFKLKHARNSQEAIDILSTTKINLILSDIHMPGLTGLELLKSIRADKEKSKIPVLIMTNLPTVEKEQEAMNLGAADFIRKELFNSDSGKILELVRMKIVTNVQVKDLSSTLAESKNKLVMTLMETALSGDFEDTVEVLCSELQAILHSQMIGFWIANEDKTDLITGIGEKIPHVAYLENVAEEEAFQYLKNHRTPYFNNHIYNEGQAFFRDFSSSNGLSSEIGIPVFSINEQGLIQKGMMIPEESKLFGFMVIKRSTLYSMTEFELISKLVVQSGSVLWRLYKTKL
ncbi:MAG: response regulator [Balneolales bacterium]|nr:response regulator [Balneolales bacterium]